jgi:hypothetical protein
MAIILPLLALLLVMALDAGRLFFGWVALQNASRIGADYAASHSDAWDGQVDGFDQGWQDRYRLLVQQDLQALGCQGNPVPDPDFDPDGDGTDNVADGALVRVELECSFGLLTPLAEFFLGEPVTLHGRSDFAINHAVVGGVQAPGPPPPPPGGSPPGPCTAPQMLSYRVNAARTLWSDAGFTSDVQTTRPGNYVIAQQSPLAYGEQGDCNTTIETVSP